jgi:hypothetical protein
MAVHIHPQLALGMIGQQQQRVVMVAAMYDIRGKTVAG